MAALLTNANKDSAEASTALTGDAYVIVSGNFSGSAQVRFTLDADSLDDYVFLSGPDAFIVQGTTGQTLSASVIGGNTTNTSIDVSVL